jgi:integrase
MRRLLNSKEVARLVEPGRYAVGHGLYLQVSQRRTRAWVFRYRRGGKAHHIGLGSCTYIPLAEARDRAFDLRRDLIRGIDPLTAKRAAKRELAETAHPCPTFKECAQQYIAAHEGMWRGNKSREQWLGSLKNHVYPKIGSISVADVDTAHVLAVLDPLAQTVRETAGRVQNRIAAILDWAAARNLRPHDNPARRKLMPPLKKKKEHFAALDYRDVSAFLAELRGRTEVCARPLELQILTAVRPSEALGARWSEIDGDLWTIPAERTKSGDPHRVPLSARAVELLARSPREAGSPFVFTGRWAGTCPTTKGLTDLLRRMGRKVTAHGFRATFRTWCEEQTAFPHAVVEAALGHKIPSAVERAYQRSDLIEKRKRLMQEWADFCSTPAATLRQELRTGEVVPLRA